MPVEFVHDAKDPKDAYKLLMAYDGSGRRVSKTRLMKSAADSDWLVYLITHYTGIGTEVRESIRRAASAETKVVVNLPQGLGRYGADDAVNSRGNGRSFEWYLKNHLGSTMLVYGTQWVDDENLADVGAPLAAYDYRAFGEQVDLTMPTDKVTENFTGKEKDDETELNYFGARYLDPMLGMWTSVDPARQFLSPYQYAGNGMNPVNVVDGDGNYTIANVDGKLGFFYSNLAEHLVYGVYNNFIPFSGLYTSKMREGELKNTLKPSKTEGVFSAVVDAVSLGMGKLFKVTKPIYYAFKTADRINKIDGAYELIQKNPLFEIFMADLTMAIFASDEKKLAERVEWATTYGLDLYNKGIEINEDVKKQFHTDYIEQFGYDGE